MTTEKGGPHPRLRGARGLPWSRLRALVFPALAVGVALFLWGPGFDPEAVRDALREREVERALELLAAAEAGDLPAALLAVRWWTAAERSGALAALAAQADEELFEPREPPAFVAPLERFREPPRAFRLREPSDRVLAFELVNIELGLSAAASELPVGTSEIVPGVTLLAGTSYHMSLAESGGTLVAFAGFEILSGPEARAVGLALRAAHDLAPDESTGALLAAIVALHHGLLDEALQRLTPLRGDPPLRRVATELSALALAEQGLDRSALALLATR